MVTAALTLAAAVYNPAALALPLVGEVDPRWLQTAGRLHVAVVHFPIALLLLAGLIEFGRAIFRRKTPSTTGIVCLSIGAASAAVAAALGWLHRDFSSFAGETATVLTRHQWIGIAAAGVALLALIPLLLHKEGRRWPLRLYRLGAVAGAVLVGLTGHLGGTLTYGEGYLTELLLTPQPDPLAATTASDTGGAGGATPAIELKIPDIKTVKFPADGKIDFARDVQPILAHSCYECHGAAKRRGALRVDNKEATYKGGNSGPSVHPGKADESPLLRRVLGLDNQKRMPLNADPLPEEHVKILRAWIDQGASWPDAASIEGGKEEVHWAYVKPVRPELPKTNDTTWARNGIDAFILAKLEEKGLKPSPEADRATLIRRVSLDLTGLPPTPEEVDAFVNDPSANAYEKVVNRLLSSPHYGERWGRHWLDIARYADTNGYEKDNPRIIWPYRDWVINALNRDTTFDQFAVQQLAGDMLPGATAEDHVATGFHRNTMFNEEGGIDAEEFRYMAVVDRVQTTGTAFLGMTIHCAQCHTHKYDAISHTEYFQFFKLFNDADEPQFDVPSNDVTAKRQEIDAQIAKLEAELESQFPTRDEQLDWAVVAPAKLTATSGATFAKQEDGSYLVGGDEVPEKDAYVLEIETDLANLTGLKLEALTDPSLVKNGPGRQGGGKKRPEGNGNFAVTELRATAVVSATGQVLPLSFIRPEADFSQANWDVAKAIDGDPATGWAGADGTGVNKSRTATFRFKDPLPAGSGRLTVTIDQSLDRHPLGKFRVSLARLKPQPPTTMPVEQQRATFLAAKMAEWEKQVAAKCANWTVLDPKSYSRKHGATITELPDKSLLFTGDLYYRDEYQLQFDTDLKGLTALRLEVLPHDELPKGGPGRNPNGGFRLTELTASVLPLCKVDDAEAKPTPITFQNPSADASPETVAQALDGKLDVHWTVPNGEAKTRTAVFQIKDGKTVGGDCGTRLALNINSNFFSSEALGRVRVSVTTDEKSAAASGLPAEIEAIVLTPSDKRTPEQSAALKRHFLLTTPYLADQQRAIAAARAGEPAYQTTLVMRERATPRVTRRHHRGEFLQPKEAIERAGVPAVLPQLPEGAPANRLTLARWLVSEENPLTARVTVNRIWSRYFGRGIVASVEDFGVMGEKPTHPELLDWLATEFVRNNWSLKSLHRLIVTSATYRQSSFVTDEHRQKDPENVLLARGPRLRVEAETVRDIALAASGLLSTKVGGPSVFPPQPAGVEQLSYGPTRWVTSVGPDRYRRGMYTFAKRTALYPGLTTFDGPTSEVVCARRVRSNTPLQALTTMNDEVFVEAAQAMARRVAAEAPDTESRLQRVFRLCVARQPDATELAAVRGFFEKQLERFRTDKAGDAAAIVSLDPAKAKDVAVASGMDLPELAAWTVVARTVMNLDETITKE